MKSRLLSLLAMAAALASAPVLAQTASAPAETVIEEDTGSPNPFQEALGRSASIEFSYEPKADLDRGGEFSYGDMRISAPIYGGRITGSWFYGFRFKYQLSQFDWDGQDFYDNDLLHRVDLRVSLIYRPENSPWIGFLSGGPALSTDGNTINSDDFLGVGIFGVGYRFNDSFTLTGGGFFSQEFGQPRFLGAPGFIWTPNSQWAASLIGPRLRVAYAPNDDWRFALEAYPDGGRWSIDTTDGQEAFLDRRGGRSGLRIERRLFGDGWFNLSGGWVFSRELRLRDTDDREIFVSDGDSGAYLSAGFQWRF